MITVTELQAINKKVAEANAQKEKEYVEVEVLPVIENRILKANADGLSYITLSLSKSELSAKGRKLILNTLIETGYKISHSASWGYFVSWER